MKKYLLPLIILLAFGASACTYYALWKSNQTLNKFEKIKQKLDSISLTSGEKSAAIVKKILGEIAKKYPNGNPMVDSIQVLHSQEKELIKFIENIDYQLINLSIISDSGTGKMENKTETVLNRELLLGEKTGAESEDCGKGLAGALKRKLDAFYIRTFNTYNAEKPKDQQWKEEERILKGTREICWEKYTFDGPIVANRAMLEAIKQDVYKREMALWQDYAQRLKMTL